MATIRLEKTVAAPIDYVFELLSDHGNYTRFRGVRSSEVVREGVPAPNGLGAIRRIALGPIVFEEEITAFEPPTRMDYLIREVNLPLDHRGGTITLSSAGNATQVLWISEFETPIRLIGGAVGATGAALLKRGFGSMLDQIERSHRAASQGAARGLPSQPAGSAGRNRR
jgi:hypothetical protein